jgi:hypothetical protein
MEQSNFINDPETINNYVRKLPIIKKAYDA